MKLQDAVVLITGANRGIGRVFAEAALARGARKVYAGARRPADVNLAGVSAVRLDVTSDADVAAAAAACRDVTLVINNAGIVQPGSLLGQGGIAALRTHFETNVVGVLRVIQHFAPILAENGGGAFLNVLSIASWLNSGVLNGYAASKSGAWGLTNGLRNELRGQNTQVLGLHMGFVDTDMTQGMNVPKTPPQIIVAAALDALEAGASEVLADERTHRIKQGLTAEPPVYLVNADAALYAGVKPR